MRKRVLEQTDTPGYRGACKDRSDARLDERRHRSAGRGGGAAPLHQVTTGRVSERQRFVGPRACARILQAHQSATGRIEKRAGSPRSDQREDGAGGVRGRRTPGPRGASRTGDDIVGQQLYGLPQLWDRALGVGACHKAVKREGGRVVRRELAVATMSSGEDRVVEHLHALAVARRVRLPQSGERPHAVGKHDQIDIVVERRPTGIREPGQERPAALREPTRELSCLAAVVSPSREQGPQASRRACAAVQALVPRQGHVDVGRIIAVRQDAQAGWQTRDRGGRKRSKHLRSAGSNQHHLPGHALQGRLSVAGTRPPPECGTLRAGRFLELPEEARRPLPGRACLRCVLRAQTQTRCRVLGDMAQRVVDERRAAATDVRDRRGKPLDVHRLWPIAHPRPIRADDPRFRPLRLEDVVQRLGDRRPTVGARLRSWAIHPRQRVAPQQRQQQHRQSDSSCGLPHRREHTASPVDAEPRGSGAPLWLPTHQRIAAG